MTYVYITIGILFVVLIAAMCYAIKREEGIQVHIDALVQGGYACHTNIVPLCELTGRNYTQSVFIPGSLIVLNIERDFEKVCTTRRLSYFFTKSVTLSPPKST